MIDTHFDLVLAMRLDRIQISHFRSIKSADIAADAVTALVGENNAGKSAVLRALNAFFNYSEEEGSFRNGQHDHSPKAKTRIEIHFKSAVPPAELSSYFNSGILKVVLQPQKGKASYRVRDAANNLVDFPEDARECLFSYITFVFVPPTRDYSRIENAERSLLIEITNHYLQSKTSKRDTLSPAVVALTGRFEASVFDRISKLVRDNYPIDGSFNYNIKFNDGIDYSHILHNYRLFIEDNGMPFRMEDLGSGIQSLTIVAMYKTLAKMKHKRFILGIEEPETNLHPHAQREVISALAREAVSDQAGIQVFLTTHSAAVVDELDHHNIVLFRRAKSTSASRSFCSSSSQLETNFFDVHGLDREKHFRFFRYKNSEFFFARHVVLVEGPVDAEVVKFIADHEGISLAQKGISILNIDGIQSLKYPASLFSELLMPFTVIVDKDWFFDYKNKAVDSSRDRNGFPEYSNVMKDEARVFLDSYVTNARDRSKVEQLLLTNHTESLSILRKYNLISFRFNLETDLVASEEAVRIYGRMLNIPDAQLSKRKVLVDNKKAIKKPDNVLGVLSQLPIRNWPHSYKAIRDHLHVIGSDALLE